MPEWVAHLLIRFCEVRNLAPDLNQLQQNYLRIDLAYEGELEINYLAEQASLIFSLCIPEPINTSRLKRLLHANHYVQQRPYLPTFHLLDSAIVLRTQVVTNTLSVADMDTVFAFLLQHKNTLLEA